MNEMIGLNPVNAGLRAKLRRKLKGVSPNVFLLLDTSSSMMGAPIDRLREIADNFKDVRKIEFNSEAREMEPNQQIGEAEGGTAMHVAFNLVKRLGGDRAVIITDGEPDDERLALTASEGLQVDVIFVGHEPAPPFLTKLAAERDGTYGAESLQSLLIETKIQLLLEAGNPAGGKGPIEL